jgi:hypothetical protein
MHYCSLENSDDDESSRHTLAHRKQRNVRTRSKTEQCIRASSLYTGLVQSGSERCTSSRRRRSIMNPSSSVTQRRPRSAQNKSSPPSTTPGQPRNDLADQDLPTRSYSSPRLRNVFLLCLAFRSVVALVGQKTFFQPDEFYQSLEPAHRMVWGTGYETWEWRDSFPGLVGGGHAEKHVLAWENDVELTTELDDDKQKTEGNWKTRIRNHILQSSELKQLLLGINPANNGSDDDRKRGPRPLNGLLRSWVWPLLFAIPYWALKVTGLDKVGSLLVSRYSRMPCAIAEELMSDL